MQDISSTISVSCASDHHYFCGLLVTLHSLCAHARAGVTLRLHVLDTGLTEEDHTLLKNVEQQFSNKTVEVYFHSVSTEQFTQMPAWRGGYTAYARLILQDLLIDEDFTIYTDVDTLWLRDIAELWDARDEHAIQAVPDGSGWQIFSSGGFKVSKFAEHGVTIEPQNYFCSGLFLMNLRRLRELHFTDLWQTLLKNHPEMLEFPDQDIYNLLLPVPETRLLDPLWGEFAVAYGLRDLTLPRVIHYANAAPWTHKVSAIGMKWWEWLAKEIGFEALGNEAERFRKAYRQRTKQFARLRQPWCFNLIYGRYRYLKYSVWSKNCRLIYPERSMESCGVSYEARILLNLIGLIGLCVLFFTVAPFFVALGLSVVLASAGALYTLKNLWVWPRYRAAQPLVLMLHSVNPKIVCMSGRNNSIRPEDLERLIVELRTAGYVFQTLSEALDHPVRRAVVLTFDDGWKDNYMFLYPMFTRLNVKATLFYTQADELNFFMSSEQLLELDRSGHFEIGGHTVSHCKLNTEPDTQKVIWEVAENKRWLEALLGHPIRSFAYPSGDYDERSIAAVQSAGYQCAVTTSKGQRALALAPFEIHRQIIPRDRTVFQKYLLATRGKCRA